MELHHSPLYASGKLIPLFIDAALAYFLPVIDEVLSSRVSPEYFNYLRYRMERLTQSR
jgi:hypothetical protein